MNRLSISDIFQLLSGVALFLFGMTLMGDGLKKVAGNKLEIILYKLSNTPIKGVLLGTGVTGVIQSSCATSVMVVGFVNSGMMKVRQAISVILGAILGTSVTGWVICLSYIEGGGSLKSLLSTSTLTAVIAVIGIILRMFSKKQFNHHLGDILMGFAILMSGMHMMSQSVGSLGEMPWFTDMLTTLSNPLLGILVGAAFTAILQSASAAIGIVQALSYTGKMTFETAFPLVLGICIGASVPVLLSALGANTDGKRTAMVYLVAEVIGVIVCASLFYIATAIFDMPFMTMTVDPFSVAFVNMMLRLAKLLLLMPFIDVIEAIVTLLIPEKKLTEEEDPTLRLEERFINHPALAIEQSRITINTMAGLARDSLLEAFGLLEHYTDEGFEKVQGMESMVDKYEDRLGTYLVKLTGHELTEKQNEEVSKFLHTISDFERISDHALNVAEAAQEVHEKQIVFSEAGKHELTVVGSAVLEIVNTAIKAFVENDLSLADRVEPLEELIDNLCDELKLHHVDRLQHGACTLHQGFVFNDLLTNYERVSDHCSNIAVAMVELESDAFDTHEYLNSVKEMRSVSFEHYFEEYRERFSI